MRRPLWEQRCSASCVGPALCLLRASSNRGLLKCTGLQAAGPGGGQLWAADLLTPRATRTDFVQPPLAAGGPAPPPGTYWWDRRVDRRVSRLSPEALGGELYDLCVEVPSRTTTSHWNQPLGPSSPLNVHKLHFWGTPWASHFYGADGSQEGGPHSCRGQSQHLGGRLRPVGAPQPLQPQWLPPHRHSLPADKGLHSPSSRPPWKGQQQGLNSGGGGRLAQGPKPQV